jgi:hypothetical protein
MFSLKKSALNWLILNEILKYMQTYNKIMLYFWLVAGVVSLLVVSYNCITIGMDKWGFYFSMPAIAFLMFFFKRMMMRRMEKHVEYLKTVKKDEFENN